MVNKDKVMFKKLNSLVEEFIRQRAEGSKFGKIENRAFNWN
ncbi:hypothetical protein [Clostridium zeae]|nr:hypothetical protein [Clostridium zeae]